MSDFKLKNFKISDIKELRDNPKYQTFFDVDCSLS